MYECKGLTFVVLDVHVCAHACMCCLQLQGHCNPSRWLVDEDDQGLGRQGYMDRQDPGNTVQSE